MIVPIEKGLDAMIHHELMHRPLFPDTCGPGSSPAIERIPATAPVAANRVVNAQKLERVIGRFERARKPRNSCVAQRPVFHPDNIFGRWQRQRRRGLGVALHVEDDEQRRPPDECVVVLAGAAALGIGTLIGIRIRVAVGIAFIRPDGADDRNSFASRQERALTTTIEEVGEAEATAGEHRRGTLEWTHRGR